MNNAESILNDIEKDCVRQFANNPTLFEAVKKVLLYPVYMDGIMQPGKSVEPYKNFALNIYKNQNGEMYGDEELGRLTKVRRMSVELVETAFKELSFFKTVEEEEENINQAI